MFTPEYYREKWQTAVRQAEYAESEGDKKFYFMMARRWADLLPADEITAAPPNESVLDNSTTLIRVTTPSDAAKRFDETRTDLRFRRR